MSVLTNIPLNLMSQPTPEKDEDTKQSTLKKIDAGAKSTSPESEIPARRKATQRYFPPPFSRAVYEQFLSSLKNGKSCYPSSKELRAISFASDDSNVRPRKRFRQLLARLNVNTVEGVLVFSANTTQDVLISKRTRKIIVAAEDAEMIVKRAHVSGSNSGEFSDETKQKHKSYSETVEVLQTDFSVHRRDFGIDRTVIRRVITNCQSCALAELSSDDDYDMPSHNGFSACNGSKPSRQKRSVSSIGRPRFSSMIAHVTDRQCIWYDRKSIEKSSNKYQKLLLILLEMKGDMSLAVHGRVGARHRLETKLYCCQLLIKDYLKTIQQSLQTVASEDISTQLQSLQQEYQEANQSSMLHSDLQNVLINVKNNKLVLPPLLGTQIEEYLNESSDTLKF